MDSESLESIKLTIPALLTSTAIICGSFVLFRNEKKSLHWTERLRLSCVSGEIVDSFAMTLGLVSFVVGIGMFFCVLFLSLPVGAQVGICVSVCGLCLVFLAAARYAKVNGIVSFLPEKMRDDLTRKSFLELWEAPPPAWVPVVVKYVKELVLVGMAKGEDRAVLIDRLPTSFTRRGMAYFLPRSLQNVILPPTMRIQQDGGVSINNRVLLSHSHDRVVGRTSNSSHHTMPLNHPATTPDQPPCPFSSMFGSSSSSNNNTASSRRSLSGSDVIRNLVMSELKRTILGISGKKLNLAFMVSAGVLAFQLTARRARSDIWRVISAVSTILTSVSTGGLFAAVLCRWILKHQTSGQNNTSLLNSATSAVVLAMSQCRSLALRSMNRLKAMILVFVLYFRQHLLGVPRADSSNNSGEDNDEDGTTAGQ